MSSFDEFWNNQQYANSLADKVLAEVFWNASRAALIGEVEPVATIGTKAYSTYCYSLGKNWEEPEGKKCVMWLASIPSVGTLLYTADQLATAYAKGREAGLREAMDSIVDIAEPTLDEYEPKQLFSAGIRASILEIERLLDKKP